MPTCIHFVFLTIPELEAGNINVHMRYTVSLIKYLQDIQYQGRNFSLNLLARKITYSTYLE